MRRKVIWTRQQLTMGRTRYFLRPAWLGRDDPVREHADALDLGLEPIAGPQELAERGAHALGRARGDDVAREQREALREHADALVDGKDHLRRVTRLPRLAVDPEGDRERLGIRDLVGGDEHRAHRAEGVERLALEPLAVTLLEVAGGHVVDDGVAEHVRERSLARDVAPRRADDRR